MASLLILLVVLPGFCIAAAAAADKFVEMDCQSESQGVYGQHSLLKCVVKPTKNATITVVTWKKAEVPKVPKVKPLLLFYKDKISFPAGLPGFQFAEPSWDEKNMNVSLLLTNTKMADTGVYECSVQTDIGYISGKTALSVTARYQDPTMTSVPERDIKQNTDVTIFCHSKGGDQKGSIQWFDQEGSRVGTGSAELEANLTDGGLFSLSSRLTVRKATASSSQYNCTVLNARGVKEGEATIQLQFEPQESPPERLTGDTTKIVAPIVVIGALIVGILLALLVFKRRSRQARRPSAAPLMSHDHDRINTGDPDTEAPNDVELQ